MPMGSLLGVAREISCKELLDVGVGSLLGVATITNQPVGGLSNYV